MPSYLPTEKILADPTKPTRLFWVLQPFLTSDLVRPKAGWWDEIWHECKNNIYDKAGMKRRIIGHVEIYHIYHQKLLESLPQLRGETVIFQNGITADMSPEYPQQIGVDHASKRNSLSYEQIMMFKRHPEINPLPFVFQPVAPVLIPYRVRVNEAAEGGYDAPAVFEDIIEGTNKLFEPRKEIKVGKNGKVYERNIKGKFRMGGPARTLDTEAKRGIYKFSEGMFNPRRAKEYYPYYEPAVIDRYCEFNRGLMINACLAYMELAGISKVHLFSRRTSYPMKIVKKAAEISGRPFSDFSKIMRNKRYPVRAESERSSISILEGAVSAMWDAYYADNPRIVPF